MAYKELVTKKPFIINKNLRSTIFNLYSPVDSSFTKVYQPHPKLLAEMPPTRWTLFRNRYVVDNTNGAS